MKEIISLIAMGVLLLLTGCGHNVLTFSSGKYLNFGVDPNTGKTGIQYIDGEQVTVVEKDNATLTVDIEDSIDASGKVTRKVSRITYEIKEQITGSDVDLEKVKDGSTVGNAAGQ
jgi:hypothetical protein